MTPRAKPLPADWEQMARLLWLPEPEQLGRDHPGGDTWAPLGLRTTTKTRGFYGGKSHTNVELFPRLSGTRHGRKVVVNPRDPMCPKLMKWGTVGPSVCRTRVIVKAPRFALRTRGGRLASDGECDRRIERRLDDLSAAHNGSRLRIGGDGGGIAVTWRFPSAWSQTRPQWPYHLWLAEQLADSLGL